VSTIFPSLSLSSNATVVISRESSPIFSTSVIIVVPFSVTSKEEFR